MHKDIDDLLDNKYKKKLENKENTEISGESRNGLGGFLMTSNGDGTNM